MALLWAPHGTHPPGTPVGTLQHPAAAKKRVSWLRCPQIVLSGSPKLWRGWFQPGLAHRALQRCWGPFLHGNHGVQLPRQTQPPSTPTPAAGGTSRPTTPRQQAEGCPKQSRDPVAHMSPPSSTTGPGTRVPRPGTPLPAPAEAAGAASPIQAGIGCHHHVTGEGRDASLPGSFPVCCCF